MTPYLEGKKQNINKLKSFIYYLLNYLMTGTANNRREHGTRCVISGETGFAHTGSIVHYQCGYFFVTHFRIFLGFVKTVTFENKNNSLVTTLDNKKKNPSLKELSK